MSTIHPLKASSSGLTALKLLLFVLAFAAGATILLVTFESNQMTSQAQPVTAPEAEQIKDITIPTSWSDEWYEIQKALPISTVEDTPTF